MANMMITDKMVVGREFAPGKVGLSSGQSRTFLRTKSTFPTEKQCVSHRETSNSRLGNTGLTCFQPSGRNIQSTLRSLVLLALMLFWGVGSIWGQTGYSGVYYIGSHGYNANNPNSNYYLCPTEGWIFTSQPMIGLLMVQPTPIRS